MIGKEYKDEELGRILVKSNPRARHIIFRNRPQALYITVPLGIEEKEIWEVLERYREKLLKTGKQIKQQLIDLNYTIQADYFQLTLVQGQMDRFLVRSELKKITIVCPPGINFEDETLQQWLRKVIEEALKKSAKDILPVRLSMLARKAGLPYNSLKINSSKGRWGSCSTRKNINLSFYLMLLPEYLIDYVLLHELAHTQEMNHGKRFWILLNRLTEGKALELRKKLKDYKTDF